MITFLALITILFLALALGVSQIEQKSGYLGDSSMVSGCLCAGLGMLLIIIAIGLCTDLIKISIQ